MSHPSSLIAFRQCIYFICKPIPVKTELKFARIILDRATSYIPNPMTLACPDKLFPWLIRILIKGGIPLQSSELFRAKITF